jgi:ribosomal protein S18 acetylase RimI-like enzyme
MGEIRIRAANLEDIATLREFEQGVILAERPFDPSLKPDPITYYDIEQLVTSPEVRFSIAEVHGSLVACGYAKIIEAKPYVKHDREAYLGLMYVLPEFRRRGINNLILEDLYRWALSRGVTELTLEVYPENIGAIRAYEKVGFKPYILQMNASLEGRSSDENKLG